MEQQNTPQTQIMSVTDWLINLVLVAIPLVGIVLLFVWAFGNDENITRKNWAKANLLLAAIMFAFTLLIILPIFGLAIFGITNQQ